MRNESYTMLSCDQIHAVRHFIMRVSVGVTETITAPEEMEVICPLKCGVCDTLLCRWHPEIGPRAALIRSDSVQFLLQEGP